MKKILILMTVIGSITLANNSCFNQDYKKIKKDVNEAKKLKEDKSSMAKLKYSKHVLAISKSVKHIKDEHFKDMDTQQKNEINDISTSFAN